MCCPMDAWERFYEDYRRFLDRLGLELELEMDITDDEEEEDDDAMIIATPDVLSEWGDEDLDDLPSMDDFVWQ